MKKKLLKFFPIILFIAFSPFIAFAQNAICGSGVQGILCKFGQILNAVVPVIISLGLVYLVWGIVQYFIADAEEAKKSGKNRIVYGIIGLAVIVSVWGLVNIVINTFGLGAVSAPTFASGSNACVVGKTFKGIVNYVVCVINKSVIPLIFAVALVSFIWGVVQFFIINADEEAKRAQGKQFMIWGIIALTVMVSVWGLVRVLGSTFGINTTIIPKTKE